MIQLIKKLFSWKRRVFLCHLTSNDVSVMVHLNTGNLVLEGAR